MKITYVFVQEHLWLSVLKKCICKYVLMKKETGQINQKQEYPKTKLVDKW